MVILAMNYSTCSFLFLFRRELSNSVSTFDTSRSFWNFTSEMQKVTHSKSIFNIIWLLFSQVKQDAGTITKITGAIIFLPDHSRHFHITYQTAEALMMIGQIILPIPIKITWEKSVIGWRNT